MVQRAGGKSALKAIVDTYLSTAHRDAPEGGCAFATLAGELARESPAARRALTVRLDDPETSGEILAAARRHLIESAK